MILRGSLTTLGEKIGNRPWAFFLPTLAVAILSIPAVILTKHTLSLDLEQGFASSAAEAHRSVDLQISFFKGGGKPWYMGVFAEPRDPSKGSVIGDGYNEFAGFYKDIKANVTIMSNERGNFTFFDYCGDMCHLNDALFKTIGVYQTMGWLMGMKIEWPVTKVMAYNANIGKHLFRRTVDNEGHLSRVELGALYFMQFINGTEMNEALQNFEKQAYIEANRHNSDPTKKTNIIVHSAVGMEGEILRGMTEVGKYAGVGLLTAFALLLLSLSLMAALFSRLSVWTALLGVVVFCLPVIVVFSTLTVLTFLGIPFNLLVLMSPVVAIGLTLDGCLHLFHAWLEADKTRLSASNGQQLSYVFEHFLPSSLIFSLSFIPLFVVALFCLTPGFSHLFTCLALTAMFSAFFQIFLIAPLIVLLVPQKKHDLISETKRRNGGEEGCGEKLVRLLSSSIIFRMVMLTLLCAGLAGATYFINTRSPANMDYRDLLPPDSANRKGAGIMTDTVWPDLLHIIFFVERPPDFTDPQQFSEFMNFLNESATSEDAMGAEADMVWVYDFMHFLKVNPNTTSLNMSHFRQFITHDVYSAWNSGVRYSWEEDGSPKIDRMIAMIAFNGTRSLSGKAKLINQCREIAARYPRFDLVPFDTEVGMVDVLNEIPIIANFYPLILSFSITVFFFIFSPNVASALIAGAANYCINYLTMGLLLYLGMEFNPFTVGFFLLVSSLSGRLVIHFTFHYHEIGIYENIHSATDNRMLGVFQKSALPTIMSSIIGMTLLLPLPFNPIPIFTYFGLTAAAQLGIGLIVSFLILPSLLPMIPNALVGAGIIYTKT